MLCALADDLALSNYCPYRFLHIFGAMAARANLGREVTLRVGERPVIPCRSGGRSRYLFVQFNPLLSLCHPCRRLNPRIWS